MRCVAGVADTEISKQSSVLIFKNYEVIKMRVQCSFETSKTKTRILNVNILKSFTQKGLESSNSGKTELGSLPIHTAYVTAESINYSAISLT